MSEEEQIIQEYQNRINQLEEENFTLAQAFQPSDNPLASEKNFDLIAGKDEIPEKYKPFNSVLSPTTQWMYIKSPEEEDEWVDKTKHLVDTWLFQNPLSDLTPFDEKTILIHADKRFNKSYGGFERNGINSNMQAINHQTESVVPVSINPRKPTLLQKLNPFRRN